MYYSSTITGSSTLTKSQHFTKWTVIHLFESLCRFAIFGFKWNKCVCSDSPHLQKQKYTVGVAVTCQCTVTLLLSVHEVYFSLLLLLVLRCSRRYGSTSSLQPYWWGGSLTLMMHFATCRDQTYANAMWHTRLDKFCYHGVGKCASANQRFPCIYDFSPELWFLVWKWWGRVSKSTKSIYIYNIFNWPEPWSC